MAHVAIVRSLVPHARLAAIDAKQAAAADGVLGVFTAADLKAETYGRSVRDVPVLAREKVRFAGERVAAVVAESRAAAEAAAALVDITYDDLPAVLSPGAALLPGAPAVHEAPWDYPRAAVTAADGTNVQSRVRHGSPDEAEAALRSAAHVIDQTYTTASGHQGYLEPQACVAAVRDGVVRIWATNKSPYRLRSQLAECLGLDPLSIQIEPVPLGGNFGGKGSPMDIPLCVELARLTGRPVKLVLRYADDLTATNPRHPSRIRVRAGCDSGEPADGGRRARRPRRRRLRGIQAAGHREPARHRRLHAGLRRAGRGGRDRHHVHEHGAARPHALTGCAAGRVRARVRPRRARRGRRLAIGRVPAPQPRAPRTAEQHRQGLGPGPRRADTRRGDLGRRRAPGSRRRPAGCAEPAWRSTRARPRAWRRPASGWCPWPTGGSGPECRSRRPGPAAIRSSGTGSPPNSGQRAQAAAVDPVVITSSTNKIRCPRSAFAPLGLKAPDTFLRRLALVKPACVTVARTRRSTFFTGV